MNRFRLVCLFSILSTTVVSAAPLVINHEQGNSAYFTTITQSEIQLAKDTLHIAYGHTSHGSQVTSGMNGLVDFINGGGLGMSRPTDFYDWNNGGSGGDLDLHDYFASGDCGYYPQWVDGTESYLDNDDNSDVNVIIWSWCGQAGGKYAAGTLLSQYLEPMNQLESKYSDVTFVYMTQHTEISDGNVRLANQAIRDYCIANDKILYDFADIESYDPDGTYYEFVDDDCDYFTEGGTKLGNWATEWQGTHTQGVDWYSCSSAHSEALNANQKAYAAWALWTEIAAMRTADPIDGDLNDDGSVNSGDLDIVREHWGDTVTAGDLLSGDPSGDGFVGSADLDIVRGNWGNTAAAAVPEPGMVVLAVMGVLFFWMKR